MTIEQVLNLLEAITGFSGKVVWWAWPEGEAPSLPFICYYTPEANNFGADNIVYFAANHFIVELYTEKKEPQTEALVEAKLTSSGIFYTKEWDFIEGENCYLTRYEIEV